MLATEAVHMLWRQASPYLVLLWGLSCGDLGGDLEKDLQSGTIQPLLEVMYLKCDLQPIDTTPVFDPVISKYAATLDWKMKYFSVQARPVPPAILDNIRLCPQEADCLQQEQPVVTMDFSRNILVRPGGQVLFMFDVLLHGVVKSYTLIVRRLEGTETSLRHIIIQGATLNPVFRPQEEKYRCLLETDAEIAQTEIHVLDGGQTVHTTADLPVPLDPNDNITMLKNTHPGIFRSPHSRLLREEAFGEFQYPNKYADFIVPLMSKRRIHIKVVSADGGHFGFYTILLARGGCPPEMPLFDASLRSCVRFCNKGFYPDLEDMRCNQCRSLCANCMSLDECIQCEVSSGRIRYVLDNETLQCRLVKLPMWEDHPQEAFAAGASCVGLAIFLCGLAAMRRASAILESNEGSFMKRHGRHPVLESQGRHCGPHARPEYTKGYGVSGAHRAPVVHGYMPVDTDEQDPLL